jgi:transcriptional regulator with XRE-family HTH domain
MALMKPDDIRMGRAALNWSLDQLAQASGVHRNTISNFETGKYNSEPEKLAAIKRTLQSAGVIFPDETGDTSSVKLRRFQVGDVVRFRSQSRVPESYGIAAVELGTIVGVEPHPPQTGPTYKIEVQFERARVPYIFKYEYELVWAPPLGNVVKLRHTTAPTTSEVSGADVDAFSNFCVSLGSIWRHHQIVFDGTDLQRELLQNIAHTFFGDLNQLLIEHLILQICKITDPEESMGRKNLTVKFLLANSDFSTTPSELDKLKRLSDSMHNFRAKIVHARNRLIGHLDRESVLLGQPLGGADNKEWNQFWLDLQDFLQIVHKRYVDPHGHFYLNGIGQLSDADLLVKALKESTYFHALLDDKTITKKAGEVAFASKYSKA